MNFDRAFTYISNFDHKYLIIGFKTDGYRGIPPTYETVVTTAKDQDHVFALIDKLNQFRVYELGQETMSMNEWVEAKKDNDVENKENEEKALLKKLKAKYEQK